jgi:hypothetical protein
MTTRRDFIAAAAATAALSASGDAEPATEADTACSASAERGIRVRFLGSGAAGWKREWAEKNPHMRRQSSVLLDGKVLIDFTNCSFDMLPEGCRPEVLFQTHSHGDHYNPKAAVKVGVKRMYVQETWAAAARRQVEEAAAELSLPAPEVVALPFDRAVEECGLRITGVPANHSTSRVTDGVLERTSLYLVEKGPSRLLYATDTGGIPGDAARMIGIDPHIRPENFDRYAASAPYVAKPTALTAFIMEATDGDLDEDFRMFVHSSVQAVARTVAMLKKNGRYAPPEGQPAYITHLGIKYRGWPAEKIDAELPDSLRAASDGLEVVLG